MFDPKATLAQLTREEKVQLLCGLDAWHLHGIERLDIPPITLTDGPHGVRLSTSSTLDGSASPATVFPVEAAMGASWNTDLMRQAAAAIGDECQALGVSVLLGPGLNGKRTPLGGRNFEYFSEDPFLTGAMASAFVDGLQSRGVGACVKHFAGNEQETRRFLVNAEIDERTLQELYVEPFAKAIREANPWTVMGAYNGVNGPHACQSPDLLQRILRDQLGYEGLVMSDWVAVKDKVASHLNGLDLEMPGPAERDQQLLNALNSGELSESILDEHALRVLELINRCLDNRRDVQPDWSANHEIAVQLAAESAVLLKNDGDVLPLSSSQRLAVIGDFAKNPRFQGGGSSHMTARTLSKALKAIDTRAEIDFAPGYTEMTVSAAQKNEAVALAHEADAVVLLTGTTDAMESEGFDRADMKLAPDHIDLINAVAAANKNLVVVIHAGSAVETRQFEAVVPALLHTWLPGEGGGEALARVLFGETNPSGKLSESFPVQLEHNPTYETFPGTKETVAYSEGIFTGYRYYDTKELPVQYPFGHGLSYSRFTLSDVAFDADQRRVSVSVKNIGDRAGAEVVQLYIHDETSTYRRPFHELKGFAKVYLEAGAEQRVDIDLDEHAFAYFVPHLGRFAEESGRFELRLGVSSRDIRATLWVDVESDTEVRLLPNLSDTVADWLNDSRTAVIMQPIFDRLGFKTEHPMYGIALGFPIPQLIDFIPQMGFTKADAESTLRELTDGWQRLN
ncbi:beta-glucosidase [Saccharospirillum mangrovi]|uniref:beta-glucosidase n=1 Tax=Saccharospirillum mangrovi TaxID=2161747 RepID=UPI0013B3F7D8|nr:glycoside hydrolase family 3 C-terminal domain-containing protein [Saccharospirillum mangrovi]